MEMRQNFSIEEQDGQVVLITTIEKQMSINEAMVEVQKLQSEMAQNKKQRDDLKKAVENNEPQKNLEIVEQQYDKLEKLFSDWNAILSPSMDKLKEEVRGRIAAKKAATGYNRISKGDDKIIKSGMIMAEVAQELDLDVGHPVMRELRAKFDKL